MNLRGFLVLAAAGTLSAAASVGCGTIARARAAQRAVKGAASAETTNVVVTQSAPLPVFGPKDGPAEFIRYALTNRPSVVSARLAVESAALALRKTHSDRYPQLSVDGGYSRATHNTSTKTHATMSGSPSAEFTLDYVVYDFGRIRANERGADENLVAALHDLRIAELTVGYEVRSAYYTLLMDDALLEVARTNEWQYAEHLRQSEKQFKEGVVKKLDVTQARMNLSNATLSTISASNEVISASAALMRSLGLTTDRTTRDLVLPRAADPLDPLVRVRLPRTDYASAAALVLARTNSPSLLVLRAKLRAASAAVDYAVADLFPELSLSSAFDFSDPSFPNTWNWSWGLKVVQSLFQGFRKTTAVDQAVVAMKAARADVAIEEQQLSLDLAQAVAARDTSRQSFATAQIVVAQSKENLDLATEQYRLGEISSIDLLDAESAYDVALGNSVKAAYGEQIAEAKLGQLTGTWRPSEEDHHEKVD